MPATITALCCLQAFLLEGRASKSLFLTAQAIAPLFDRTVARSKLPLAIVALHALLFAGSLLLGASASRFDAYHGGAAMNALVKSLSPLLSALLQGQRSWRHWLAAIGSFVGIALATDFHDQWPAAPALLAYTCLFGGTVLGVLHGLLQQHSGNCPLEMAIGAAALCAASLYWEPAPRQFGAELLIGVPLYGALSLYVSRAVRDYSTSINYDAFRFSLMLNERRAATIALGALRSPAPLRLVGGAALALASIQLAELSLPGRSAKR
jgi:hypothetical protein